MRKSSISQDLVKLVPRLKTWNWEKQRWGRVYLVLHIPIASDTFPPWTPDVTEGCSGVDFYSTEWNCAARRKHMQLQGERGERTQERKGENDGGRLLRRRVFGGGVREWEEREARKESVWRGGGGKRVKERERGPRAATDAAAAAAAAVWQFPTHTERGRREEIRARMKKE